MQSLGLTLNSLLWALFCAAAFITWPTVGKYSGASGHWINTLVLIFSAIGGVALAYPELRVQPLPSGKTVLMMMAASLVNGAAVYFYSLKTADPSVPTGTFIAVTTMMMVVLGLVIAVALTNQALSMRQMVGLGLALLAIWLIAG